MVREIGDVFNLQNGWKKNFHYKEAEETAYQERDLLENILLEFLWFACMGSSVQISAISSYHYLLVPFLSRTL